MTPVKPAIETLLTAKVASMNPMQRDERAQELYEAPASPENTLEFTKLMFGNDFTIE